MSVSKLSFSRAGIRGENSAVPFGAGLEGQHQRMRGSTECGVGEGRLVAVLPPKFSLVRVAAKENTSLVPPSQQKRKPGFYNYRLEKPSTSRPPAGPQTREGRSSLSAVGTQIPGSGSKMGFFSLKGLTIFAKTRQTLGVAGKTPLLHTEIPSTGKLAGALSQPPAKPRAAQLQS